MVRGRYRVGVSKTKTKEKIMMKKKVMPLSCLMAAAMLAGCGTAAPAVPEETTAPAVETAEAAQETAPADAREAAYAAAVVAFQKQIAANEAAYLAAIAK